MKRIILASGSPRRKELLESLGLDFEIIVSDADEKCDKTIPGELVMALSALKAKAVEDIIKEDNNEEYVIIGADTIVYADGEILGKPKDEADAKRIIIKLSGNTHSVYTGVTLCSDTGSTSFFVETKVNVNKLTDCEIEEYTKLSEIKDKAGAYAIQGAFAKYIDSIEGDYYNVVGLPISRLYQELKSYL